MPRPARSASYRTRVLTTRQRLGLQGERIAAAWLRRQGWSVLARRYRSGHRDIDLVVARPGPAGGRTVAFVEVRTRASLEQGTPAESVGWRKQRELCRSARAWLASNRRSGDCYRFDVVGVLLRGEEVRIQYVPDAFWVRGMG